MSGATGPVPWDDYLKPAVYTSIVGAVVLAVAGKGSMNADMGKSVAVLAGANILGNYITYNMFPGTVIFDDARVVPSITGGLIYAGGEHFVHPGHAGKDLAVGIGSNLIGNMLARDKVKANSLLLTLKTKKESQGANH